MISQALLYHSCIANIAFLFNQPLPLSGLTQHTKCIGVYSFRFFRNNVFLCVCVCVCVYVYVCVCVCLCVCNYFSVKDFSGTTAPKILKFVQTLGMTCVLMLIFSLICPFFFFSSKLFCHRFLSSYESQSLQILYTPTEG